MSLGIVKPTILKGYMEDRKDVEDTIQTTLDSTMNFRTVENYQKQPRVRYRCTDCKISNPHDQKILEWDLRIHAKEPPPITKTVSRRLTSLDPSYEKYFLVGNLAKHRNSFVVVSVFRFKTS